MAIQVDMRVPTGAPVLETAAFAETCEGAGLDGVGIIDHQHTGREVFMALAAAAARTSRVTIYPAVTNPVTRHPMVMAAALQSLEEMAPGRVLTVVGAGNMATRMINSRPATLAEMRAYVTKLRRLLSGESVYPGVAEGRMLRASDPPTPVYMAATGPRMTELAGEIADGALLQAGLNRQLADIARDHLRRGGRRAGRNVDDLPLILVSGGHLSDSVEESRDRARPFCYAWISDPVRSRRLESAGIRLPSVAGPEDIPDEVLAQVCDATGLFGTPEHWVDQIRRIGAETGAARILVQPTLNYDMPEETVRIYGERVAPALA
jgi:5,10-methylenetetrahydromethanopterin reductase